MSKVIQIRGVPTDVHDALVEAANAQGQSLTGYLLRELENVAKRAHAVQDNARIIRQTQELVEGTSERQTILAVLDEGRSQ